MTKYKKSSKNSSMFGDMTSMFAGGATAAGLQIGLGSMAATPGIPAGATASLTNASAGITNATAMFPAMGTISGMKPLFGVVSELEKSAKIKK